MSYESSLELRRNKTLQQQRHLLTLMTEPMIIKGMQELIGVSHTTIHSWMRVLYTTGHVTKIDEKVNIRNNPVTQWIATGKELEIAATEEDTRFKPEPKEDTITGARVYTAAILDAIKAKYDGMWNPDAMRPSHDRGVSGSTLSGIF